MASETFVINQIVGLVKLGIDIDIISIHRGDLSINNAELDKYNLIGRTTYLLDEKDGARKIEVFAQRSCAILMNLFSLKTLLSLNVRRFGIHAKSLILPCLAAKIRAPIVTDIVISHFGTTSVIANKLHSLGLLVGELLTVFHGADISRKDILERYKNDYSELFVQGRAFLPVSHLWKKKLVAMGCPAEKIYINRMGINTDEFHCRELDVPIKMPLSIVTTARLVEKKGVKYALEAMSLLKCKGVEFHYRVIGDGPLMAQLQKSIDDLNLTEHVEFLGYQPQHLVKEILSESDIFLLPSVTAINGDMEGIPVALMEAMASGLLVLSTKHSGIPELIKSGCSGFLVNECSPEGIAEDIYRITEGLYDLQSIRSRACATISNQYSLDVTSVELIDLCRNIYGR